MTRGHSAKILLQISLSRTSACLHLVLDFVMERKHRCGTRFPHRSEALVYVGSLYVPIAPIAPLAIAMPFFGPQVSCRQGSPRARGRHSAGARCRRPGQRWPRTQGRVGGLPTRHQLADDDLYFCESLDSGLRSCGLHFPRRRLSDFWKWSFDEVADVCLGRCGLRAQRLGDHWRCASALVAQIIQGRVSTSGVADALQLLRKPRHHLSLGA